MLAIPEEKVGAVLRTKTYKDPDNVPVDKVIIILNIILNINLEVSDSTQVVVTKEEAKEVSEVVEIILQLDGNVLAVQIDST
jgi:hypothetical protein